MFFEDAVGLFNLKITIFDITFSPGKGVRLAEIPPLAWVGGGQSLNIRNLLYAIVLVVFFRERKGPLLSGYEYAPLFIERVLGVFLQY